MEPTVSGDMTTNSPNGQESSFYHDYVELYVLSAILALFAVVGTAGNAIVICVYKRQKEKSVSTLFILTLALVDFIACLFNIPFAIFKENVAFRLRYDFICKTSLLFHHANVLFSAFVMVAIAIDRYFAICHPFKRVMTVFRAKLLVVCMAVIASAIGVCYSLTIGVYYSAPAGSGKFKDGETFGSKEGRKESTTDIYQSEIYVNSSGFEVIIKQSSVGINQVTSPTEITHPEVLRAIFYDGCCYLNALIFSWKVQRALYHFLSALYIFCFVVVLVLYILIYRYVLLQQKIRRQMQMGTHLSLTRTAQTSITANCHRKRSWRVKMSLSSCLSTTRSPSCDDDVLDSSSSGLPQTSEGSSPHSAVSAAARAANLKTAAMLFVVTIVFALSFLPIGLIQFRLIPYNLTALYMYFVNNVANPIIYSFMNSSFREKAKNLICRR